MQIELSKAAAIMQGKLVGADRLFSGASIDTRTINDKELFFAFQGQHVDGHQYINQSNELNIFGAVVDHYIDCSIPQIIVNDVHHSLIELAKFWRKASDITVIGITGSNGKTTVKEMTRSILSIDAQVHATPGNFNNEIGVPLTILGIKENHDVCICELGISRVGDMDLLLDIAMPGIGLVNNISNAHIAGFDSLQQIAEEKGKLYQALPMDGIGVINLDDTYAKLWLDQLQYKQWFGFSFDNQQQNAHIYLSDSSNNQGICWSIRCADDGSAEVLLPVPGIHNVSNALAAATIAHAYGCKADQIKLGLESYQHPSHRFQKHQLADGSVLIDDSYNANPQSFIAGIKTVLAGAGDKKVWLIAGDMEELGADSELAHSNLGEIAKKLGVKKLFAVGQYSQLTVEGFGKEGYHFSNFLDLIEAVYDHWNSAVYCLVKGSRASAMENVVADLLAMLNQNKCIAKSDQGS